MTVACRAMTSAVSRAPIATMRMPTETTTSISVKPARRAAGGRARRAARNSLDTGSSEVVGIDDVSAGAGGALTRAAAAHPNAARRKGGTRRVPPLLGRGAGGAVGLDQQAAWAQAVVRGTGGLWTDQTRAPVLEWSAETQYAPAAETQPVTV